jgi:hypothetical protein
MRYCLYKNLRKTLEREFWRSLKDSIFLLYLLVGFALFYELHYIPKNSLGNNLPYKLLQ